MKQKTTEKLYTLKEACEFLSISTATGRNWVKSGRLVASSSRNKKTFFEEAYLFSLKKALTEGTLPGLKRRRNKTCISGQQTCHSYIAKESKNHAALTQLSFLLEKEGLVTEDTLLLFLLRHCAEGLIFMAGYQDLTLFQDLLNNLAPEKEFSAFKAAHSSLCEINYTYYRNEDTLGFLYLSLCSLQSRKTSGSYYTPTSLAKKLVEQHLLPVDSSKTILDPSCGTGIFLLQLPESIPLQNIFGTDLNPVSIALARINLALKYKVTSPTEILLLQKNITVSDFLGSTDTEIVSYDIILGNPPWGARLSADEKRRYRHYFSCAAGSSADIFDLFIEQGINRLLKNGILSFILPEALLTVKVHTPVRKLLLKNTTVCSVEYLGEAFEQVHCPSIILTVRKSTGQPFFKNAVISLGSSMFTTQVERTVSADSFCFSLTDEDYLLLQKILSCPMCTTLVDKADFALGIVTGNNAAILKTAFAPGLEPVIKGSDISKYHINSFSGYMRFQPELLQQTAPEQFYRAQEKLFYRFINKRLIFAYDNTGLLSLNSCNILIPHIKGLSVKYILAVLNSSVAQFVFEKKFRSVKVLRSHLEQIPIPIADADTQAKITAQVDLLMKFEEASPEYCKTFAILDFEIAKLFGLTKEEYKKIGG